MVRRFPTYENPFLGPTISSSLSFSFSFLVVAATMAAAISMITTLCGVRFRRRSPPSPPSSSSSPSTPTTDRTTTLSSSTPPPPPPLDSDNESATPPIKELPLPPKMRNVSNSGPLYQTAATAIAMAKSASERKLNHMRSMSFRIPRSLSVAKNREHKDDNRQRKKEKMKIEDSIWTKTIILGEKCKVPDEDKDAVIYEGKGKKISAYHPRAQSSMSMSMSMTMSRHNSFVDHDVHSNQETR